MGQLLAAVTTYKEYFTDSNYSEFAGPMAQVDNLGNSIYYIMMMVACFAGIIVLMLVGLKMSIGNSKEKVSGKDKLISSICVLTAIFILANLINEVAGIVAGFQIW